MQTQLQSKNLSRLLYWAIVATAPLAILALIKFPGIENYLPKCLFLKMTGHPCPSCGLTRSVVLALHGDLVASFNMHPFGVVALAAFAGIFIMAIAGLVLKRPPFSLFGKTSRYTAIALLTAYLILWMVRLCKF